MKILMFQVLPVMIMGAFIPGLRRKYPAHEYISAVLLVVGLIIFTLADAQTSPNFSILGVVMISGALIMDSFLGNLQEAIFTMNPETTQVIPHWSYPCFCGWLHVKKKADSKLTKQMEMLFCSTVVGLPFLIPPMLLTGELFKAWTSCSQVTVSSLSLSLELHFLLPFSPFSSFFSTPIVLSETHILRIPCFMQHKYVYGVLIFEAMATYVGQVSVLSLIALFGAATTAMVLFTS